MSKYKRYLFLKKIYPNYVIFLLSHQKLITFDYDLKLIEYIGIKDFFNLRINYIILNCLEICEKKEYSENYYFYYFKFTLLKEIIIYLKDKIGKKN